LFLFGKNAYLPLHSLSAFQVSKHWAAASLSLSRFLFASVILSFKASILSLFRTDRSSRRERERGREREGERKREIEREREREREKATKSRLCFLLAIIHGLNWTPKKIRK
jgi:hypothetical protein